MSSFPKLSELDIPTGIASLLECVDGTCESRSRYFVGELTGRRLNVRFHTSRHGTTGSRVTAFVNDENVGQLDEAKGPPIGFFGFAVAKDTDLKEIQDVLLTPSISPKISTRKYD